MTPFETPCRLFTLPDQQYVLLEFRMMTGVGDGVTYGGGGCASMYSCLSYMLYDKNPNPPMDRMNDKKTYTWMIW